MQEVGWVRDLVMSQCWRGSSFLSVRLVGARLLVVLLVEVLGDCLYVGGGRGGGPVFSSDAVASSMGLCIVGGVNCVVVYTTTHAITTLHGRVEEAGLSSTAAWCCVQTEAL